MCWVPPGAARAQHLPLQDTRGWMSQAGGCADGGGWVGVVHRALPAPCCLQLFIPVPVGTPWLSGHAFALAFASLHSWHLCFPKSDVSCNNYSEICPLALIRPLKSRSWLPATHSTRGTGPLWAVSNSEQQGTRRRQNAPCPIAYITPNSTVTREDQAAWSKLLWVWRGSMNLQRCVEEKLSSYLPPRTVAAFLPAHLACKNTAGTPTFCPSGTGFQ